VTLNEVGDLIISPDAEFLLRGNYVNRRGVRGYFVQVKSGSNWCRISVSNADRHSHRTAVAELDTLNGTMIESGVVIPNDSLSDAFKSSVASNASVNRYLNDAGVAGIWAEFYYRNNWYMVSVSHIDIPLHATPEGLDRLAEEFLSQQGVTRRKRRFS